MGLKALAGILLAVLAPSAAAAPKAATGLRATKITATAARGAPPGGHSSKHIAMSDPRARWIPIATSGVNRASVPS